MSYTFDEENNFTVHYFMNGFSVYSQTGKYEIGDDRSTITFSLSSTNNANIPNGIARLSGEFFFKREDDQIWIGNKCYQKNGMLRQEAANLQESKAILQDSNGNNTEHLLSGGYTAQNYATQMSYTFDKEKNVTVRFLAGGFPVYSCQGIYEINGDGTIITFSFPTDNNEGNSYLSNGMNSISGAFSFKEDYDKIWIGNVCYQKDGTLQQDNNNNNNGVSSSNSNVLEEPIELRDIRLKLPERYSVSYQVTYESYGISQTYTQTVTHADEGIFTDLNPNERYVFELLDSGKYMQYRYNFLTGKYETAIPTMAIGDHIAAEITTEDMFAVDYSVVASYTSRIEDFLDYYENFRSYAIYQDNENINGIDCRKFIASFDSLGGNHFVEFWVDPTTGICVKGIYRYQSGAVMKVFLCTDFKAGEAALPDYK